jgi:hypothetical protein
MHKLCLTLFLSALSVPGFAQGPALGVATNGERETAFASLAECEKTLVGSRPAGSKAQGSLFNRRAGNISVCAIVHGEPQIVVYPRGSIPTRRLR